MGCSVMEVETIDLFKIKIGIIVIDTEKERILIDSIICNGKIYFYAYSECYSGRGSQLANNGKTLFKERTALIGFILESIDSPILKKYIFFEKELAYCYLWERDKANVIADKILSLLKDKDKL